MAIVDVPDAPREKLFRISICDVLSNISSVCILRSSTIADLLAVIANAVQRQQNEIDASWKLGNSFTEEKEECLNELPQEQTLEEFVNSHSDLFNKDGWQEEFYVTVQLKHLGPDTEQEKYNFQPNWLFTDQNEKENPAASASSSVEANVDTAETVRFGSQSSSAGRSDDLSEHTGFRFRSYVRKEEQQKGSGPLYLMDSETSRAAGFQQAGRDTDDVYVGLVNQAMTCYLNSLLQTLFMTPEFRNALYNWEYTGMKEEQDKSIPYQLQKLFVLLQTSVNMKTALETKELTKSFGWDSSHAWDQHDVQELCRVMFDALEFKWRRTNQAAVITQLYQGTMKDYVKCLECSTENARNDVFLDLPLAVKPFGAQQAYRSIEEALQAFVQPEILDGTNQYHCEKCQKKVNAHKGLKITKFPYLLTIQLKRFDFDYTTMHRIKLNDRMTFPNLLNLNPFVEVEEPAASATEDVTNNRVPSDTEADDAGESGTVNDGLPDGDQANSHEAQKEIVVGAGGESDDEGICVDGTMGGGTSGAGSPTDGDDDVDNVVDRADTTVIRRSVDEQQIEEFLKEGPNVYELFSIMVHSGSANGGHYYAYIKNLDTKVWYCFNDQVVTRASMEDIRKTYGGASSSPFMYSSYGSSTNAYMLMYRQVDPGRNLKLPAMNKLPEHILRMIDKLHLEEEEQRLLEERQRSMATVRVHVYDPIDGRLRNKEFEIHKRDPVSKLVATAHEDFGLGSPPFNIPLELCRLVRFSKHREIMETSLDSSKSIQQESPWAFGVPDFLLEIAPRPGWFRPYTTYGVTLTLYIVDLEAGSVRLPKKLLYATKEMTVNDLKQRIAELLDCNPAELNLVLDHYSHNLRLLDVPHKKLSEEDMWGPIAIFVECGPLKDEEQKIATMTPEEFEKTRFYAILDQFKNKIMVEVILPSIKDYHALGFTPPFSVETTPIEAIDDVHMVSAKNSPCSPLPSVIPAPTVDSAVTGAPTRSTLQQAEDCSTASGSTQYVTPATSRSPSLEHLPMSPISHDDGLTMPELDVTLVSGNATPSPQVSPDVSPCGSNRNAPFEEGQLESIQPRELHFNDYAVDCRPGQRADHHILLEGVIGRGDRSDSDKLLEFISAPANDYQPPTCPTFDNDLSKIDIDLDTDTRPADNEKMGAVAKESTTPTPPSEKIDYFFNVVAIQDASVSATGPVRVISIEADRRMLLVDFNQKLSQYVGVPVDQFKLYKVFQTSEYECVFSAVSTLDAISSTNAVRVKLGRPLKDGELLVKFLRFEPNDLEATGKHLFDIALTKSSKIADVKRECQIHLKRQCGMDVTMDRIRLRDSGNGFMDILHDTSLISDRYSHWSNDFYLQILEEPESATTLQHIGVFIRRWCPSTLSLGPVQEIILPPKPRAGPLGLLYDTDLFIRVSQLSNIPIKRLQFSSVVSEGAFPYDCGKLKLLEDVQFHGLPADLEQTLQSSISTGCEVDSEGDGRKNTDKENEEEGAQTSQEVEYRYPAKESECFGGGNSGGFQFATSALFRPNRNLWGGSSFNSLHDGMLIYYRDSQEQPKTLKDDERKELQIRDNARLRKNQTSYSWRKERALKIYTEISSSLADELD